MEYSDLACCSCDIDPTISVRWVTTFAISLISDRETVVVEMHNVFEHTVLICLREVQRYRYV